MFKCAVRFDFSCNESSSHFLSYPKECILSSPYAHTASFRGVRLSTQTPSLTFEKAGQHESPLPCSGHLPLLCRNLSLYFKQGKFQHWQNQQCWNIKKKYHFKKYADQFPKKCWMKLAVLSALSNGPSLFWIPRNKRTSSARVILLNFLSWHLSYSWMHRVSRHNTLQETSYKVLPMRSCGHYNIHSSIVCMAALAAARALAPTTRISLLNTLQKLVNSKQKSLRTRAEAAHCMKHTKKSCFCNALAKAL